MSTDKSSASNAKTNDTEDGKKTAATQTAKPASQIGSDESRKTTAATTQKPKDDAETGSTRSKKDDGDKRSVDRDTLMFRGMLMAVLIRLPAGLAYGSQGAALDEMMDFVETFETKEERVVVVEMIKAIADVSITDIPGGGYKSRVLSAMDVVYGDAVQDYGIRDPHSSHAASDRLNLSLGGIPMPPEHQALEAERRQIDGAATAEQRAAAERLYGSSVA